MWSEVREVVRQPEVIIAGIESLWTEDDGQLEERAAQAERNLRHVQSEEDRLIRLYVLQESLNGVQDSAAWRCQPNRARA